MNKARHTKTREEAVEFLRDRWQDAEEFGYHRDFLVDDDVAALLDFIYGKVE